MEEPVSPGHAYSKPQLFIELVLLTSTFLVAAASSAYGFTVERRALADFCIELDASDCMSTEVNSKSALWVRWINVCETIPALFALPFLGTFSDSLKRLNPCSPAARAPLIALQILFMMISPFCFIAECAFGLPRWSQLVGASLAALGGGLLAMLPCLFAMRSDATPHPSQRAAAFLRMELAIFSGLAFGLWVAAVLLGSTSSPVEMQQRQQVVFVVIMSMQAATAMLQLGFWTCPPPLHAVHEVPHLMRRRATLPASLKPEGSSCLSTIKWQLIELWLHLKELWSHLRVHGKYAASVFIIFSISAYVYLSLGLVRALYLALVGWPARTIGSFSAFASATSAGHLLLAPVLLAWVRTPERLLALELRACTIGVLLWTISPAIPPELYRGIMFFTSASATVFPLIRAIGTQLAPPEQVGAALAALGICEHASAGAGRFFFLSLYGVTAASVPSLSFAVMSSLSLGSAVLASFLGGMSQGQIIHPIDSRAAAQQLL